MFYNKFDRIDIIKKYREIVGGKIEEEKRLHEICYNVKKIGTAGICQTVGDKGNWGFCSRSCTVDRDLGNGEPYEEAEFKYFDEAPEGSLFAGLIVFHEHRMGN